jgi:hypothetical protein
VCANAGIVGYSRGHEIPAQDSRDVIDMNLARALGGKPLILRK